MDNLVDILDFDECYDYQDYYKKSNYKKIELLDIRNANRYCENDTLKSIYRRISNFKKSKITFIGSGNYHYITYILLNRMKKPFTLVLFDHHTDMIEPPDENIISCGSWALKALEEISLLKKVIILGVDGSLVDTIPDKIKHKVICHPEEELSKGGLDDIIEKEIESEYVYLSIDKDVLSENDAGTNWDQGHMTIKQLIKIIKEISNEHDICGVDVCGECDINPIYGLQSDTKAAMTKNNLANHTILEEINNI